MTTSTIEVIGQHNRLVELISRLTIPARSNEIDTYFMINVDAECDRFHIVFERFGFQYPSKEKGTAERNVQFVKQQTSMENDIWSVTEINRHIQSFLFMYSPNSVTQISTADLVLKQT